jgi:chromosomal replication initiation ATPase DnaA
MMLTELHHYCGNSPTAKAAGRLVPEVAADELVSTLESALRRLRTDPANVSTTIAQLARRTLASLTRIRIEERLAKVSGHVAREFRLTLEELQSRSREQRITFARQLAMFMAREITSAPFGLIGQHFNRDHSTAVHAHRLIEQRLAHEPRFRLLIEKLERQITGAVPATPARRA